MVSVGADWAKRYSALRRRDRLALAHSAPSNTERASDLQHKLAQVLRRTHYGDYYSAATAHNVIGQSDDLDLIEINMPADYVTVKCSL